MKKMLMIIVALVLVIVLVGGGVAAYFIFKPKHTEEVQEAPKQLPVIAFIPLDPFTVNLKSEKGPERFAQISLTLALTDAKSDPLIKQQLPLLRDRILKIIAQKTPEQLLSQEGKDVLAGEIMQALKDNLPGELSKNIKEVLFNGFIVQ